MTLGEKQELFSYLHAVLVLFLYGRGYKVRTGEVLRTREEALKNAKDGDGIANSLHCLKLAVDLSLFKDGVWLNESEDYAEAGAFWKSLNPLCCWGGDFSKPDGGHFSITHNGVR